MWPLTQSPHRIHAPEALCSSPPPPRPTRTRRKAVQLTSVPDSTPYVSGQQMQNVHIALVQPQLPSLPFTGPAQRTMQSRCAQIAFDTAVMVSHITRGLRPRSSNCASTYDQLNLPHGVESSNSRRTPQPVTGRVAKEAKCARTHTHTHTGRRINVGGPATQGRRKRQWRPTKWRQLMCSSSGDPGARATVGVGVRGSNPPQPWLGLPTPHGATTRRQPKQQPPVVACPGHVAEPH